MSTQKPSLVTVCPACTATFYVTPEQLSAHRGVVSCGKCSHIFNALERLSELPETSAEPESLPEADNLDVDQPEETVIQPYAYTVISGPLDTASPTITVDLASKTKLNHPSRTKSNEVFILLALVFALLAATQVTYYMRTQIASRWPGLKPYLVKSCALLGCTVELLRKIELLAIDDSDLQEDAEYQGLIHLSSTIINHATFVQAYPRLEVTLTDTYDKPLLRRAFTPREYLPANTNISRGMLAGEEVRVRLAMTASGESVAGYRVFVTYP